MRSLLFVLAAALVGCSQTLPPRVETIRRPPAADRTAPSQDEEVLVVAPDGRPSPIVASRDVVLEGVSIVGRWEAVRVEGDPQATDDLRRGLLAKVLIVNPTGRATLRGRDARQSGGQPVSFIGRVDGSALRLADLPGAASLWLQGDRLHVLDPGGTTTVYAWAGR